MVWWEGQNTGLGESYRITAWNAWIERASSYEAVERDAARYRWLLENPGDAILVFSEATNQDTYGLERDQIIGAYRIAHYVPERIDELAAPSVSVRPPKPKECEVACPPQQVCDHCQWPPSYSDIHGEGS